ncbi:MAG: hypothetical protein PVJ80_14035 [Gemmatimonadota bacterium]|jgi:mono/diheme cytochrome c family protein
MNMLRTSTVASLVLTMTTTACSWPGRALRGYASADANGLASLDEGGAFHNAPASMKGQVRFLFEDFGSLDTDELETYAIPWKLASSALVRARHERTGEPIGAGAVEAAMAEYGFIAPRRIANWQGPQPRLDKPMGIVSGVASRGFPAVEVEIANVGCATCHAAPLYGADGLPTSDAWIGLPNASIDLSAYADDVVAALRKELTRPDTLMATIDRLYPRMSERERATLWKYLIPRAREDLEERVAEYGGLLPFENGGPGLMNGVGSLRFVIGTIHRDAREIEMAWASPPDLNGTTMRRALLVDGVYAPPGSPRFGAMSRDEVTPEHLDDLAGVASLFVSGTQGIAPADAREGISSVRQIMDLVSSLEPPRFPGSIDRDLAERGRGVYEEACASCHGTYSPELDRPRLLSHPNRFVAQDRMGTDPARWMAADSVSLRIIDEIGYDGYIDAVGSAGYVAPDLTAIWATAPYLHNGSVPTLWHLLHSEARPERFYVGGHALDYDKVGIAGHTDGDGTYRYPHGYEPWSRPMLYDTTERGRSNVGHDFQTLTEAEKHAVLEYMKVL